MVGGNLGKECVFVSILMAVIVALEHDTSLHHLNLGWVIVRASWLRRPNPSN
jgi:hypothetical protein